MKKFQWPLRAFLFIALYQLVSCTKTVDTDTNGSVNVETSDNLTFPTSSEFATCKLRRFHSNIDPENPITGLVTYNNTGNPFSIIVTQRLTDPGYYNHYFYYDKQQRLREYRMFYEEDYPVEGIKHLYGYDANNRIIVDTAISNPGCDEDCERINVTTFTYDEKGRIVKENIRNIKAAFGLPLNPTRNPTYTYDSRGNLAVAGWKSSSYDNKVSIFRSHPVFQFIHRNYSRNNAAPQPGYNSPGLPLTMNPGNDIFLNYSVLTKVIYDCQ